MAIVTDASAILTKGHWAGVFQTVTTGTPVILTYSFPTAPTSGYVAKWGQPFVDTFRAFSEEEKLVARAALDAWSSVSGLTFVEVPSQSGSVRFAWGVFNEGSLGYGSWPYSPFLIDTSIGGVSPSLQSYWRDTGANYDFSGTTSYDPTFSIPSAQYFEWVVLHEIGHALGLKHPFEDDPTLEKSLDNRANTIMSYSGEYLGKLGPLDIAAVQSAYGAADKDGTQFSSWHYDASRIIFTLIGKEGPDNVRGTSVSDVIVGLAGDDVIFADTGNDKISGGSGNDRIAGGDGIDTLYFDSPYAVADIGPLQGYWRRITTKEGIDFVAEVERFAFSDLTIAYDANAYEIYRVYQAAFARTPDRSGLSYWVNQVDEGLSLRDVAYGFVQSVEFIKKYGSNPSSNELVEAFYQNVLGRKGDEMGIKYWINIISAGTNIIDVLVSFANSQENINNTSSLVSNGIVLDTSPLM